MDGTSFFGGVAQQLVLLGYHVDVGAADLVRVDLRDGEVDVAGVGAVTNTSG